MFQSSSLVPDLQPPSFRVSRPLPDCRRHDPCSDCVFTGTTKILLRWSTLSWKPDHHRSCHAPSRAAKRFCTKAHAFHTSSGSVTHLHAPSRARFLLLTSALGDVITATSSTDVISQSADVIVDQTVDLSWLWPLTLTHGWLFQSRFFLPSFSRRFHFYSMFLYIVSLNG